MKNDRAFGSKVDGLGLDFYHEKHDVLIEKIYKSQDGQAVWWVVDEFLFSRFTFNEAIQELSKLKLQLDNLELIEFLENYREYKTFTP